MSATSTIRNSLKSKYQDSFKRQISPQKLGGHQPFIYLINCVQISFYPTYFREIQFRNVSFDGGGERRQYIL